MKLKKSILAGLIALSAVSIANADQVIHLTGSTAFRAATITAIENLMEANSTAWTVAYVSANTRSAGSDDETTNGQVILQGTLSSSGGVSTVKCSWAGSVGGVLCVTKQLDINTIPGGNLWLSSTNLTTGTTTETGSVLTKGTFRRFLSANASTTTDGGETLKADASMSDSLQTSTPYTTPVLTGSDITQTVGVVPFEFVMNNGAPTTVTNLSTQQAVGVFKGGILLSQLTGNSADSLPVYGVGRNFDSGTRLAALSEMGIGVLGNVQQMIVGGATGAASTVSSVSLYNPESLFPSPYTRSYAKGQSGYSSGGTLGDVLATPGSSTVSSTAYTTGQKPLFGTKSWLIGYLGRNDANRAVKTTAGTNTAHRLTFNGVADWTGSSSAQLTNGTGGNNWLDSSIQEGVYSFWEYEFLVSLPTLSAGQNTAIAAIGTQLTSTDAVTSGILYGSMNVSKTIEGGLITHN